MLRGSRGTRNGRRSWRGRWLIAGTVVEELHPAPVEPAGGGRVPRAREPRPGLVVRLVASDDARMHEEVVLPPVGVVRVVVAAGRPAGAPVAVVSESLEPAEVVAAMRGFRVHLGRVVAPDLLFAEDGGVRADPADFPVNAPGECGGQQVRWVGLQKLSDYTRY